MITDSNQDLPIDNPIPVVAVWMVAYKHGAYIEQAIESVMMQQTNFGYKLYIGEDNSPDDTREICIQLQQKYPEKIELFLHEQNIGGNENAKQIYQACFNSGAKYIAMLEGDDYWIDASKLQQQIDFLDQHLECMFCFHSAFRITDSDAETKVSYPKISGKSVIDVAEFFQIPTIPTASVVFRNAIDFPILDHSHGDLLLYSTLLSKGKAGFLAKEMSVYRMHQQGISSAYNENWYLERRIKELYIEQRFAHFSDAVQSELQKILTDHIIHYLNKNRGHLSFAQKKHYFGILIGLWHFYRQSFQSQLTLAKTLLT